LLFRRRKEGPRVSGKKEGPRKSILRKKKEGARGEPEVLWRPIGWKRVGIKKKVRDTDRHIGGH